MLRPTRRFNEARLDEPGEPRERAELGDVDGASTKPDSMSRENAVSSEVLRLEAPIASTKPDSMSRENQAT